MSSEEIQQKIWEFFIAPTPKVEEHYSSLIASEKVRKADIRPTEFTFFTEEHADIVHALYESWFAQTGGRISGDRRDQIDSAIQEILEFCKKTRNEDVNPEAVNFALMVFLTHISRDQVYQIPPMAVREPHRILPSSFNGKGGSTEPENQLDWFREDPLLNEHHEHWHIVYPWTGIMGKMRDRQGEVFLYMHQQMLARYDTERLALGLPEVVAFDDLAEIMESGYEPGNFLRSVFPYHGERPSGSKLLDIERPMYGLPGRFGSEKFIYTVAEHEGFKARLEDAVKTGYFRVNDNSVLVTADSLGATIEAGRFSSVNNAYYGTYHNNGHRLFAVCHDPTGAKGEPMGVMSRPETSFRDPIFFRWHKHIDNLSYRWQEKQLPNSFNDAPPVRMRSGRSGKAYVWSPDIILCQRESLQGLLDVGYSFKEIGEAAFGGSSWRGDFSNGEHKVKALDTTITTTDTLHTQMERGEIFFKAENENHKVSYNYLNHKPFVMFFRIENLFPEPREVTIRVFLVAKDLADDRRMYIEIDKFRHQLRSRDESNNVIARPDTLSSIIRKPAIMNPSEYNADYDPNFGDWILRGFSFRPEELDGDLATARELIFKYSNELTAYRFRRFGDEGDFRVQEAAVAKARFVVEEELSKDALIAFDEALRVYYTAIFDLNYDRAYCGCGYPYSLLLPRGTPIGMTFNLSVIVTNWENDRVGDDHSCTSMSFCGAKDRYPDARAMGYPFDRPFPLGVERTLAELDSAAVRTIQIKQLS